MEQEKRNGKIVVFGLLAIVLLISFISVLVGRNTRASKPAPATPAAVENAVQDAAEPSD